MKKIGLLLILAFTTFFSSCEKDLYEEAVYEQPKLNGKFSTVSIEDAPFLKPSIESFKSKHFNHSNGIAYRVIDSLDLDLNKIAVYEQENGVKSYSIAVKESVFENEDYYFENLHILESGDKYEYFIIKYNPLDDSKKFDYATYTGKMEVYNEDRKFVGTIVFENGAFKLIDTTPPTGEEPIGGGGGSDPTDPDCPCNSNSPSLLSQFFSWIGDLFSNINITPGSPDNTGYVLIATSPNMGSTNNNTTPTQTTSGNNIAVTPNEPEWTYPAMSQLVMANKIMSRLVYYNPGTLSWLKNPINHDVVDQLYFYMAEGGNYADVNTFASEALIAMMNGSVVNFPNEIIIDPTLENNQKAKCVFQKLLNLNMGANFKNVIVNMFGSSDKSNIKFSIKNLPTGFDAVTVGSSPYLFPGKSMYNIILDSDFVNNASTIEIAMTLIHELIHAELLERCLRLGIITHIAYNANYDGIIIFSNGTQLNLNTPTIVLNSLIQYYNQYGAASEWNHNLMTSLNYVDVIKDDLLLVYPFLNNPNNDFLTNINNDSQNTFGNFTIEEALQFLSWTGLNSTDLFINNILNNPSENNKFNYISNASRTKFSKICN